LLFAAQDLEVLPMAEKMQPPAAGYFRRIDDPVVGAFLGEGADCLIPP
jgi:hypothetical protein